MRTNIFLNSYQQPENKLTYNFFSIIELLNDNTLFDFLTNKKTANKPLVNLETVYGGGETNPDGSFVITLIDNSQIKVLYENKTNRLGLGVNQLKGHLKLCGENDLLLVTTPRKSDIDIIKQIEDNRVIFKTWQEISLFLQKNYRDNMIVQQFVDYGKRSGEFDELGEIYHDEIKLYCDYLKVDFDKKINSIFQTLVYELDFSKFGFSNLSSAYKNNWGRKGVEFSFKKPTETTYGQFGSISLYYDTSDHGIPFLEDCPEIAFFFDVNPEYKSSLRADNEFKKLVMALENEGFESNLNNEKTPNAWRLLFFRKPIMGFQILNVQELVKFVDNVLTILLKNEATKHKYFAELQ
jgi:hypothetical protein